VLQARSNKPFSLTATCANSTLTTRSADSTSSPPEPGGYSPTLRAGPLGQRARALHTAPSLVVRTLLLSLKPRPRPPKRTPPQSLTIGVYYWQARTGAGTKPVPGHRLTPCLITHRWSASLSVRGGHGQRGPPLLIDTCSVRPWSYHRGTPRRPRSGEKTDMRFRD